MGYLTILKFKWKFKRHEKYILKKLAYHESGHLIFSHLLDIPSDFVVIDYHKLRPIELINDNLIVEYESDSRVEFFLPQQMTVILGNSRFGIDRIATQYKLTVEEVWKIINQYLFFLLAGYESQMYFTKKFKKQKLEDFEKQYSQNVTTLNPNEDINKMKILLNGLTNDNDLKNSTVKKVLELIKEYLEKEEVQKAIQLIAKKLIKKGTIHRKEINQILNDSGFSEYSKAERNKIIAKL